MKRRGAYYNEIDRKAAAWLRELIKGGHIAPGEVDERDLRDVTPSDLRGFIQHHFFAGIGVWSYALRLAGWPDDKPVWTGSCPCQPFSAAGKGTGFADERHLWPAWHWLIKEFRPSRIFGEQVASKDGIAWLDLVSSDLEGEGYSVGPVVLPACGIGAPHIRSRLWFVADSDGGNSSTEREQRGGQYGLLAEDRSSSQLAHAVLERSQGRPELAQSERASAPLLCEPSFMDHSNNRRSTIQKSGAKLGEPGPVNGYWGDSEWIFCRDEKYRPVEPGAFPLVNGAPARMGRLRGYGNAIVAQVAAEVIKASYDRSR